MKQLQFPTVRKERALKEIKEFLLEGKKFDYLLKGLGKGTWDLIQVEVYKKRLRIFSIDSESILSAIFHLILPNKKISLKIDSHMFVANEPQKNAKQLIERLGENGFKIRIHISSDDTCSLTTKFESSDTKEMVMENLSLFLRLHSVLQPHEEETEVDVTFDNYLIFKIKGKAVEIQFDIEEKKIMEVLNLILFADNKSIPCSYQFCILIENITGDWETGKREGYLIQELKDETGNREKKLKL